jgi:uncharacterized protein (TIGR03435 family)
MKRREEEVDQSVERHLKLFSAPPVQVIDDAKERTRLRLSMQPVGEANELPAEYGGRHSPWRWSRWRLGLAGAVAAVALAVVFMPRGIDAGAIVEAADGGLFLDSGRRAIQAGERLEAGNIVRANGLGAMLKLADGSHVEMRGNAKLSLEPANDGVRIQLSDGDVIVNAAKQHGHLYVQTKDVKVSVVGTVFLVKAEAGGSRVAVIEGEVHVQQGMSEKNLRPGEQAMSKPIMEWQPVSEEISWSRSAPTHLALLHQSTSSIGASTAPQPREAFDVVSIRTSASPATDGARGGGGVRRRNPRPAGEPCGSSYEPVVDPRRFDASETTVHALIAWAYGLDCKLWRGSDLVIGGPGWLKDDGFEIQAVMPDGSPSYNADQLRSHDAPKLQMMLQSMLADRFKLVIHREMKEIPVYLLTLAKGEPKLLVRGPVKKVEASPPGTAGYGEAPVVGLTLWQEADNPCCPAWGTTNMGAKKQTMAQLAGALSGYTGRPVLDRTGLTGEFNYYLRFAFVELPGSPMKAPPPDAPLKPWESPPDPRTIFAALEQDFGLHLESTRENVDVWVIDRVERPSEN